MNKRPHSLAAVLLALVLSACGGTPQPGAADSASTAPPATQAEATTAQTTGATTDAPQPQPLYTFADSAVQGIVEEYLGKSARQFTQDDLDELGRQIAFSVKGLIGTIEDIPRLFPSLKYLGLSYYGDAPISQADCDLLTSMGLLALEVYSGGGFPGYDFADGCSYASLKRSIDDEPLNPSAGGLEQAALAAVDIPDGFAVDGYTRLIAGEYIFELVDARISIPGQDGSFDDEYTCSTLYIHRLEKGQIRLVQTVAIPQRIGNASAGLHYFDADFDGNSDILVLNGGFGAQFASFYTCLLWRDGRFVEDPSFAEIPNPGIDAENRLILGTWRNSAASHSWATYEYRGGEFAMTACLTEEGDMTVDDEILFIFRDERLTDGQMQILSEINAEEYTYEEIYEMYYDPKSQWGLFGDRWQTLYNRGAMHDFSIYSSRYIDSTVYEIITSRAPPSAINRDDGGMLVYSTYPVEEVYYSKSGKSYAELSLRLPILGGDYAGIPAINAYFAGREQYFEGEGELGTILGVLESGEAVGRYFTGRDDNCYREAIYHLALKRGDILSVVAYLDGGAGGVGWAGIEGATFDLATGKKLALDDLFTVHREEYREAIYQQVAQIAQARIDDSLAKGNGAFYWFDNPYSGEGRKHLYDYWQEEDFYLSDTGLVVVYQKYVLTAGVGGPQALEIPYDKLKGIMADIF